MATAMPYPGPDADNLTWVPSPLRARPQWVLWRAEERQTKDGPQLTKVPYNAQGLTLADTTDPLTWSTYERCVKVLAQALEEWAFTYGEDYYGGGIGYVLTEDDPFVGIDLDHCVDPITGEVEAWAQAIVRAMASYTEVTPSATGLRIFVAGTLPPRHRRKGSIEMYNTVRFLTVTGWHHDDTPDDILPRQGALDDLWLSLWGVRVGDVVMVRDAYGEVINQGEPWTIMEITRSAEDRPCARFAGQAELWPLVQCEVAPPLPMSGVMTPFTDQEVMNRACVAHNGEKVRRIASGDWSGYGYESQSEADSALCWLIAFWTRDPEQIERLMRISKLVRDKWDERRGDTTWLGLTIRNALATQSEYYTDLGHIATTPMSEAVAIHDTAPGWEKAPDHAPIPDVLVTDLADMLERTYPVPQWLIPELIPEGLVFFVGSPKSSKTYLAYSLALSLAVEAERGGLWLGKYPVDDARPVVYLTLEDDEADSRFRIAELVPALTRIARDRFLFVHGLSVPRFDEGLYEVLEKQIIARYGPSLIVLDPISYLYAPTRKNADQFGEVKEMLLPLRWLGKEHHCTILGVDHRRKKSADDVDIFETTYGSNAKSAVVDGMLMIVREHTDITVHARLRKAPDQTLTLGFAFAEDGTATWEWKSSTLGLLDPGQYGDLRMKVFTALSRSERPMSVKDIIADMNMVSTPRLTNNVHHTLARAVKKDEVIKTEKGLFFLAGVNPYASEKEK